MKPSTLLLAALLALAPASAASACPSCKESIPNAASADAKALPNGFNLSVYAMLGGFFLVGGLVVRMIVREVRTTDQRP